MGYVAPPRAEFAVVVAVALEYLFAFHAVKMINSFFAHLVAILLPPCKAARVTAKYFRFALGNAHNRFTAVFASTLRNIIAMAEGFNCVLGQAGMLGDLPICPTR